MRLDESHHVNPPRTLNQILNLLRPNPDYRGQRPPGTASDAPPGVTNTPALPPPPAPNPLPPSPVKGLFPSNKIFDQLASGGPMKGMLDVEKVATQLPSGAELLVQNITVVLPGYTGPLEGLANGLVPHGSCELWQSFRRVTEGFSRPLPVPENVLLRPNRLRTARKPAKSGIHWTA